MKRLLDRIFRRLYVVLDDSDNSVTLSPRLAEIVMAGIVDTNEIHMFKAWIKGDFTFAFTVNHPELTQRKAPSAPLQKNFQQGTIGFNGYNPSVNYIYYAYNLPLGRPVRLRVEIMESNGHKLFKILNKCR